MEKSVLNQINVWLGGGLLNEDTEDGATDPEEVDGATEVDPVEEPALTPGPTPKADANKFDEEISAEKLTVYLGYITKLSEQVTNKKLKAADAIKMAKKYLSL